jgi:hypothetical protein
MRQVACTVIQQKRANRDVTQPTGDSHMNRNKNKQGPTKPFFTRFLDQQDLKSVTGGGKEDIATTLKYPSDNDETGN